MLRCIVTQSDELCAIDAFSGDADYRCQKNLKGGDRNEEGKSTQGEEGKST